MIQVIVWSIWFTNKYWTVVVMFGELSWVVFHVQTYICSQWRRQSFGVWNTVCVYMYIHYGNAPTTHLPHRELNYSWRNLNNLLFSTTTFILGIRLRLHTTQRNIGLYEKMLLYVWFNSLFQNVSLIRRCHQVSVIGFKCWPLLGANDFRAGELFITCY